MADLNNELNVPPPLLTLTPPRQPHADRWIPPRMRRSSRKAKSDPHAGSRTPLSPEEQKMVNDFAEKIDITNSQMVLQYGAATKKTERFFRDGALRVKTEKDMGRPASLITNLISEAAGL